MQNVDHVHKTFKKSFIKTKHSASFTTKRLKGRSIGDHTSAFTSQSMALHTTYEYLHARPKMHKSEVAKRDDSTQK